MTTTPDLFDWLAPARSSPVPPVPPPAPVQDSGRPTAPFFDMAWHFGKAQKKFVPYAESLDFLNQERTGQAQFLQVKVNVEEGGYDCIYRERLML